MENREERAGYEGLGDQVIRELGFGIREWVFVIGKKRMGNE